MTLLLPIRDLGEDTPARLAARLALARTLWTARGERRLPREPVLARALAACDPRDVQWVCETSSPGPIYFLPTREWIRALAALCQSLGVRRVLEVAAGDGLVSRALAIAAPTLEVTATDSGAWANGTQGLRLGKNVVALAGDAAVARYLPELVIVCWPPPSGLVGQLVRSSARFVLEVGAKDGFCGNPADTRRFPHQVLDGPIRTLALCRFDAAAQSERCSTITLYRQPDA